ncbi:MAG: carbon starvation protein A [Candidatus Cloacimonetes bacterium]|nr:carbon starvation protein A [Candidatus Cloacimonadota bacterium]
MNVLYVILMCAGVYILAYILYGRFLAKKIFKLDDRRITPAVEINDDVDFVPIKKSYLLGQHFAGIAAAGPINGPIIAAGMFGWFPALLWCVLGTIFIGGVHDFGSVIASVRHKAKSITEVVRENVSDRAWVLFMLFVWTTLVYLIIAFTDITASSLVGKQVLRDGTVFVGGGVASATIMYIFFAIVMGVLFYFFGLKEKYLLLIFVPLVFLATWFGQKIPINLELLFGQKLLVQQHVWSVVILIYCFFASILPVWLLLQPRGSMGGYFMYIALLIAAVGLVFGKFPIEYDAFKPEFLVTTQTVLDKSTSTWEEIVTVGSRLRPSLFPILFITVACGACSGFHAILGSGTTSKQLAKETDAKAVGYGGMLLEGLLACSAIACIMIFSKDSIEVTNELTKAAQPPNLIYAHGMAKFMSVFGVPLALGVAFGIMAFTTFVSDTLDVCARLGRYIFEELTGYKGILGSLIGAALTAFIPMYFVFQTTEVNGNIVPAWRIFWNLFGSANQLLAALALIGISIWLKNAYKTSKGWIATLLPALFMYVMSIWSLLIIIYDGWFKAYDGAALPKIAFFFGRRWLSIYSMGGASKPHFILPYIATILLVLAVMVGFETFVCMVYKKGRSQKVAEKSSKA